MQEIHHYDIIVIGSGPAGEKAAMQASKLKKQVALIEKLPRLGGASLHTGTIPSKSLRETVMHLALLRQQTHGIEIKFKENLTTQELMYRKEMVILDQENSLRRNFEKNNINVIEGTPRFQSATTLKITPDDSSEVFEITANYFIIATGSSPRRPKWAPFDNECVFDSDTILNIKHLPKKVTIIGAGVIGCEYASIFSKMGIRVNLIARDRNVLPFIDRQIAENFLPEVESISDTAFGIITGCVYSGFLQAYQNQQQTPSLEDIREFNQMIKNKASLIKKSISESGNRDNKVNEKTENGKV